MSSLESQFFDVVEVFLYFEEGRAILEGQFNEIGEECMVDFSEQIGDYTRVGDLLEGEDAMLLGYLQPFSVQPNQQMVALLVVITHFIIL